MELKDLLIKMIKAIDFFKNISDEQALELSKDFVLNIYQGWFPIIREWTKPEKIYLLKNWNLEVKKAKGFETIKLWEIKPWEIFGEMSYINDTRALASVTAIQTCDIWEIDVAKFDSFLKSNPDIKKDVLNIMSQRQKINQEKLVDMPPESLWEEHLKILL